MNALCQHCNNTGIVILPALYQDKMTFCDCDAGLVIAEAIAEGIQDIKAGRLRPWAEVRQELGLPPISTAAGKDEEE